MRTFDFLDLAPGRDHPATLEYGGDLRLRERISLAVAEEALGRITGRIWSEELLDAVFSKFCVGK